MGNRLKNLWPFWVSILLGPILLVIGALRASSGNENDFFAMLMFPFSFLFGGLWAIGSDSNRDATAAILILALLQFPVYGLVLSLAHRKLLAAALIWGIHIFVLALGVAVNTLL